MPSPFPGMDPYLEARWESVHVMMINAVAVALKPTLPPGLQARPEQSVIVETLAGERLTGFRADTGLVAIRPAPRPNVGPSRAEGGGGVATATASVAGTMVEPLAMVEPLRLKFFRGPVVLRDIRIYDLRDHNRLVTAIEVLSPWNKRAGGLNTDYRRKLQTFEQAGVNWVEIDLLRGRRDRLDVTWRDLPDGRSGTYMVVVRRPDRADADVYPIGLRDRLPVVPVPLREGDADAPLDLQARLDRLYDEGPFDDIDYRKPPRPRLRGDDARWATEHLAAAGYA